MNVGEKTLYNSFRKELKLPDDSAALLLEAVEDFLEYDKRNENSSIVTKEDIRTLELKLETLKEDNHKLELKIEQSKTELYRAIEQSKSENLKAISDTNKAIYLTNLLQFLGIVGAVIAIVKFMK
jgi:hypothetical protein